LNTSGTSTVTAQTDDGFTGQTTVEVGGGRIVCHMTVNDSSPTIGQRVLFYDTSDIPDGEQNVEFHWNFDDGTSVQGRNVQHTFQSAGTFNVVHSVVDDNGNTFTCAPFPIQVSS
jgi:PKD repeat protein